MKIIFLILLVFHGLIHLLGFVKGFNLAPVAQLSMPVSRTAGILWLGCTLLFLVAAAMLAFHGDGWWMVAGVAILLSQALIITMWKDARFGTMANVIVLVPVIVAAMNMLPYSFISQYKLEVKQRIGQSASPGILTEKEIEHLPAPVIRYLRFTGVVGKPKVVNVRAEFTGSMRQKPDGGWMKIRSQQYNFFDDPARLFYIEASMFGVPFDGFHQYTGNHAVMLIKVANLFSVVDARGNEMDQGETVTMFNDMCLLAPPTLADTSIVWEAVSDTIVKAIFTNKGRTIAATLHFDASGAMTNFVSQDRFYCADGKTYLNYPWSTPVKAYKEISGRKVPSYGEAVWHTPEGPFTYARFDIAEIEYNLDHFR